MLVDKTGVKGLRGTPLVAAITSVCSAAFLLFGYDQGVMSGVILSKSWLSEMDDPSTTMTGTITALYDIGAVLGALGASVTAEGLGRKRGLICGSVLLILGSTFMGAANGRALMIVGRIFTGLGIGYITSVAPVYQSEVCQTMQRGWMLCCQLTTLLAGLVLAYWINYAMYFTSGDITWRFPLLFQIVFGLYIIAVTVWLPETPRWLMYHEEKHDRGLLVLSKLRNKPIDDPDVQQEKDEILHAISLESEAEASWMDLFRDNGYSGWKRFALAVGIQFMQQTSGINIVSYYSTTIFEEYLGMSAERALLVGGCLQIWYLCASFLTWWLIEAVGRRKLFISMALGTMAVLIGEAICVQIDTYSSGIGAVFFIFLFEGCVENNIIEVLDFDANMTQFTWGWMATTWLYPAEILPLQLRAKGTGIAAAADFLGNFIVVEITPPALANIGYKTYIIFAVFNLVAAVLTFVFYPETSGLPLEAVDRLFIKDGMKDEMEPLDGGWFRRFQWSVIWKAKIAVKRAAEARKKGNQACLGDVEVSNASEVESKEATEHKEVST